MFSRNFALNFAVALESLFSNRLRSLLTALGVIFGVAAVISMLAIGNAAKQEVLHQIELVGVNNIVVKPYVETSESQEVDNDDQKEAVKKYSPGLTLEDARSIQEILPTVKHISPEVEEEVLVIQSGQSLRGKLVGVLPSFFTLGNFELEKGTMFNEDQINNGLQVCIIGNEVKSKLFPAEDPIGKFVKCGPLWLKVIGILKSKRLEQSSLDALGLRDFNLDIYTPIHTMLNRYRNRSRGPAYVPESDDEDEEESEEAAPVDKNYHQLDKLTVQVHKTEQLAQTSQLIGKILLRRHNQSEDFFVDIPEDTLKQKEETENLLNIVLAVIASISLLIGGLGIMNIMLASVLERIKEIGLRLSVGAKKTDIIMQFMLESVLISASGGLIGVLLGVFSAYLISHFAQIDTVISPESIILSFSVSLIIGLIFGILPARRAAEQDPINSLRYE